MKQIEADFCIVGSGISGMSAAYRLYKSGASVVVLEAGERLGGRIFSAKLTDGTFFEIGAEWISEDKLQPSLNRLMRALERDLHITFTTLPQYIKGQSVFVDFDGKVSYYNALPPEDKEGLPTGTGFPPVSDAAKLEIVAAFAALAYMAYEVNPKARWEPLPFDATLSCGVSGTVEADRMTIHGWLERNYRESAAKALVASLFRGVMGLEPEALSLLHAIFFLKTFGGNPLDVMGAQENQMQHLRLPNGVGQILDAVVQVVGKDAFHTNSPVRDIEQHDDHVIVRSEAATVKARRVIVATSTAAVSFIRFHPPLSPDRAQLQQRMGLGSFWKIWLAYDKPFWRAKGYCGQPEGLSGALVSIGKGSYVATTLDSSLSDDGPGLLTCFIDADKARAFAHLSHEDRRKAILREMAHAFGPEAGRLSERVKYPAVTPQDPEESAYFEWNWSLPDFIRGDYAGAPGPGVYTAVGFGPAIERRCGRVHWAGSDTSHECYGSMTGAVSTGERAAMEALSLDPICEGEPAAAE